MVESVVIDALANTDPISIITQLAILSYLVYETRRGKIKELEEVVIAMITVIRAVSKTNEDIDSSRVDKYLLDNGVNPGHFIIDDDDDNNKKGKV